MPSKAICQLLDKMAKSKVSVTSKGTLPTEKDRALSSEMEMMKFILALPFISIDMLSTYKRRCDLCQKPYNPIWRVNEHETAVVLPCGHTVGHFCIRKYLSPFEDGHKSCPKCAMMFPCKPREPLPVGSNLDWLDLAYYESPFHLDGERDDVSTTTATSASTSERGSIDEYDEEEAEFIEQLAQLDAAARTLSKEGEKGPLEHGEQKGSRSLLKWVDGFRKYL